jgi:3-keto-5-aminohexanoate cleavage enzyme
MKDIVINLTPTGMIPTKDETSHVPVEPNEIIDDVLACCELGVTMAHIHARDGSGRPEWRPEVFDRIIAGIRKENPELIICATCSGRTYPDFERRTAVLDLDGPSKPDMGSLTLSSINFNKQASVNEPDMIIGLARRMKERGIKPELEAFDLGMINYSKYLISKDLLPPPHYFNLIFGNIACAQANILSVGMMINELPDNAVCSLGGVGQFQQMINALGVVLGCGVRIGIEDNIWFDEDRTRLATNKALLQRLLVIIESMGRRVMTPARARELFRLKGPAEGYGLKP